MSLNSFTTILSAKIKVAFALNLFNNPLHRQYALLSFLVYH
jgi:hypothetical protein